MQEITATELKQRLDNGEDIQIIDVRTPQEFMGFALPHAKLFPVQTLHQKVDELPQDKNTPLLVYCAHGVRSLRAIALLENQGYVNLINLKGGLAAYLQEFPL